MKVSKSFLKIFLVVLVIGVGFLTTQSENNLTGNIVGTTSSSNSNFQDRFLRNDPSFKKVGTVLGDVHFKDLVTGEFVHLGEITKPVVLESFYVGCPSCVEGIKVYNKFYEEHGEDVVLIYLDFNPDDSEEFILSIKEENNGGDWVWVAYTPQMQVVLDQLGIIGPEQTFVIDPRTQTVVYGDSLQGYMHKVEEAVNGLL